MYREREVRSPFLWASQIPRNIYSIVAMATLSWHIENSTYFLIKFLE